MSSRKNTFGRFNNRRSDVNVSLEGIDISELMKFIQENNLGALNYDEAIKRFREHLTELDNDNDEDDDEEEDDGDENVNDLDDDYIYDKYDFDNFTDADYKKLAKETFVEEIIDYPGTKLEHLLDGFLSEDDFDDFKRFVKYFNLIGETVWYCVNAFESCYNDDIIEAADDIDEFYINEARYGRSNDIDYKYLQKMLEAEHLLMKGDYGIYISPIFVEDLINDVINI